jgi:tetratricopeptide (TPR) repeat protein
MTEEKGFDLRDQEVKGSQTNIGDANAPTFSGNVRVVNVFPKEKTLIPRLPFVPDPPSDFTGRNEELQELLAKFAAGTNIIGLRGIGGVGKTALALKLVESLKDSYPDGQIMVDMRGTTDPRSPMEAMGAVIRSYYREEKIPDSEDETRQRYLEVLNGKRTLLLLDNAHDDKQVQKLIPPKSCGLIITSRRTIKIPGLFQKDLDVLKPEEAMDLLLNVCCPAAGPEKSPRADAAWPEIARLCGYLPLALRAAACYLAISEDISPARYASDLKDERSRLGMIGEQGVEMGVDASFGLSFQKLEPMLRQIFLDLSVFPDDFDSRAEEQICQDEGHRGLSELVRWSLVDYKPHDQDYGRYRLHDLARLFSSARQSDESKAMVSQRHCSYYGEVLSAANRLYLQGGKSIQAALALFDREDENIVSGYAWAANTAGVSSAAAQLCMSYPDAGVYVLDLRLHPRQKISWLEAALAAARKLGERAIEGVHLGNLGAAYIALGEPHKAIEFYKQRLTIAQEIGDRRGEGNALGNLGLAYADLGEPHKAIEFYEQALAIDREIGDRRGEGADLGNLGSAYVVLGEPRKAIEFYEQALAIAREIGDKRGEGVDLGNLGNAYAALGEPRKAIEFYEQQLVITREIGDRSGEANANWNLGLQYEKAGDLQRAAEMMQICVDFEREIGHQDAEKGADYLEKLLEKLRK